MSIGVSLIALALGYKVFVDASRGKEGVRLLGQVIGIFVMLVALLATICGIRSQMASCMEGSGCPMKARMCQLSSQAQ